MEYIYFKHQFLPSSECFISIHDRSYRFGDGLFETMLVVGGRLFNEDAHFTRIQKGLEAFRIRLNIQGLPGTCAELIARNHLQQGYIRITISRGESADDAIGYLPGNTTPYVMVQTIARPYPAFNPITLWLSSYRAPGKSPVKSNNALTYTMAMLEAKENNCQNALLSDAQGYICETASGNIFWIKESVLYAPSPELALIPGTIAALIPALWPGEIQRGCFTTDALNEAEEIFMTNTGCLVAPVTTILPLGISLIIGHHTKSLRIALDNAINHATHSG